MLEDKDFVDHIFAYKELLHLPEEEPSSWSVENLSGNINRVRRVRLNYLQTGSYSFIVKHLPEGGRLERYPGIKFPESRLRFESQWLKLCEETNTCTEVRSPKLLCRDDEFHTLVLEDLGKKPSYADSINYCPPMINESLGRFLGAFHGQTLGVDDVNNPSAEQNRPYVLTYPLAQRNHIRQIWLEQCTNSELIEEQIVLQDWFFDEFAASLLPVLESMENNFKASGITALTHGDLHGDSILVLDSQRLGILDAELCDTGTPAFDVGTVIGHIWGNMAAANAPQDAILAAIFALVNAYDKSLAEHSNIAANDISLIREESLQYAGAEILRRTLGAATFRCLPDIKDKKGLLLIAKELLSNPKTIITEIANSGFELIGLGRNA